MALTKQQYLDDLEIYKNLKESAIKLTTQSPISTYLNANAKTVPYKRIISILNLIGARLDELNEEVPLDKNGLFMLHTALELDNLGTITYKGAVNDLYNGRITYLNNQIKRVEINLHRCNNMENTVKEKESKKENKVIQVIETMDTVLEEEMQNYIQLGKDDLHADDIELDIPLNRPVYPEYTKEDLQNIFSDNMTKILNILNKGKLVYGTPEFDNILLYISNIYEVFKDFNFDKELLSQTDYRIIRRVRICTCHNLYKDSSSLVEVCMAIGVLVSITSKLKG